MKRSPRSNTRFRQINPAFLAAHNLLDHQPENAANHNNDTAFEKALNRARDTGKLCVANGMLTCPQDLDQCFDLRADLKHEVCDYDNLEQSRRIWECHGEEALTNVDFSDNDFSKLDVVHCSLDSRIGCYRSLQTLRAKRCSLKSIDGAALSTFRTLYVLDLSGNQLQSFDLSVLPSCIQKLDLSSNRIANLHMSSSGIELNELFSLNLSDNNLTELPPVTVPALRDLSFSSNRISKLPTSYLSEFLVSIDGSQNRFEYLPNFLSLRKLVVIEFCGNNLQKPPCIGKEVQRLGLSDNSISSLKGLFSNELIENERFQSSLVDFRVQSNKMTTLDESTLLQLTALVSLNLACNDLSTLPSILGYLPNLQKLILDGNPLRTMRSALTMDIMSLKKALRSRGQKPNGDEYLGSEERFRAVASESAFIASRSSEIEDIIANGLASCSGLKVLNLNSIDLSSLQSLLSAEIEEKELQFSIEKLYLRKSKVCAIDDSFVRCLPNLVEIDAGMNKLSFLPESIAESKIKTLIVDNNQFTSPSLSSCLNTRSIFGTSLVYCNLSSNQLDVIPDELLKFSNLRTLILSFNTIKSISNWVQTSLPSLEALDLSQNRLADFGDFPLNCRISSPSLTTLILRNNEIRYIPPELGLLSTLKQIDFRGNPQKAIRTNILEKPCSEILSFLKRRLGPEYTDSGNKPAIHISSSIDPKTEQKKTVNEYEKEVSTSVTLTSSLTIELQDEISILSAQLNNVSLSQAKRYAVKKQISILKSKLIREERRLKSR